MTGCIQQNSRRAKAEKAAALGPNAQAVRVLKCVTVPSGFTRRVPCQEDEAANVTATAANVTATAAGPEAGSTTKP